MKVLITGGTGFIGSHLAEDARQRGATVVVLGLTERVEERENAQLLRDLGVKVISGSVTDRDLCFRAVEGATHVYHLAVAMREAGLPDEHFQRVNLEGTRHLLEAASQQKVERFMYCSTIGIFGHRVTGIANEESSLAPGNIYERTKVSAENLVREFWRSTGLPIVILRPTDVYGPRDKRLAKLFKSIRKGRFPLFGDGSGRRHMVYVDDVVAAFAKATERDEAVGEAFIIAGPDVCTLRELVDSIAQACGKRRFGIRLPLAPMLLIAAIAEDACTALNITPPIYRRRMDFFHSDAEFDISLAKRLLGWEPRVGLAEGIDRTLAALK